MNVQKIINISFSVSLNVLIGFGVQSIGLNTSALAQKPKDKKEEIVIENLNVIPRIKVTEKNSLKTYNWWEEKKPRIPKAYKLILKKLKDDFLLEHYNVEYAFKVLSKDNLPTFNDYYILSGNLIIDAKNKDQHELVDLTVYKINNSAMDLILISNIESQDTDTNFRTYAQRLKDKLTEKTEAASSQYLDTQAAKKFLIVFENELGYEELKQIQTNIAEHLKLGADKIQLLYSENKKYTFELKTNLNPFVALQGMVFINGPYSSEVLENTIVFKPLVQEESVETDELTN